MKATLTLLLCTLFALSAQAVTTSVNWQAEVAENAQFAALTNMSADVDMDAFLDLTPKKFRELTGERLGVKGSLALKAAQKRVKKQLKNGHSGKIATDIPKGLYIVGALLGWSWLLMGLMDDFEGNNWWVNLLLLILCFLPGVIHAFIKMGDYY